MSVLPQKSPENLMMNSLNLMGKAGGGGYEMAGADFYTQANKKFEENMIMLQNQFSEGLRQRSISSAVQDQQQTIFKGPLNNNKKIQQQIQQQRPLFSSLMTSASLSPNNKLPITSNNSLFFSSYISGMCCFYKYSGLMKLMESIFYKK